MTARKIIVRAPALGLELTWTLSPPNAPDCYCGEPSALVQGPRAKGGSFSAYRCAKGVDDNWRDKCEFNQWC